MTVQIERTYEEVADSADADEDAIADLLDVCPSLSDPGQENSDGDPFGDACDCMPADPDVYSEAVEINDGKDNQCSGEFGYGLIDEITGARFSLPTEYSWYAQEGATQYDVARSSRADFASCSAVSVPSAFWEDTEVPPVGNLFYYVVRAGAPNVGTWGQNSAGVDRAPVCE